MFGAKRRIARFLNMTIPSHLPSCGLIGLQPLRSLDSHCLRLEGSHFFLPIIFVPLYRTRDRGRVYYNVYGRPFRTYFQKIIRSR